MYERYRITAFGHLDDTDALDDIGYLLFDDQEPLDRVKRLAQNLEKSNGVFEIERSSKLGSPFEELKKLLKANNLGWQERVAEEDASFSELRTMKPGETEETVTSMSYGDPVIELSTLLDAAERGDEFLKTLLTDVSSACLYGADLKFTLADDLIARFEAELADEPVDTPAI